ncbi:MAG: peptidoglycan DD-metalloendopeptidase family protein, partial [Propionicimonas sp.]|nr:peptidoglycan DD-metalloendopeptidase family protein [Propionicimonas sp.]
ALHCGGVALVWTLAWLVPYFALLRDDVDQADYAGAPSGFLLPWPGGQDGWVIQGNNAGLNHNDDHSSQRFAWDFRRECGTPVLAARAGTVTRVVDTNAGRGDDNNLIEVRHADGSLASYLHIRQSSAAVAAGQVVAQGDPLARVGCVGNSLTGHIHFHVRSGGPTIAITFDDVDGGIPRTFGSYTSGNRATS